MVSQGVRASMRKLVLGFMALAVLAIVVPRLSKAFDRSRAVHTARDRVEQMLGAMQAAGAQQDAPEARTAACLWFKGTLEILDREELTAAVRGFAAWRSSRRLGGPVRSWQVESAALPDPNDLLTVLVVATVNGQPQPFTVLPGQPIS